MNDAISDKHHTISLILFQRIKARIYIKSDFEKKGKRVKIRKKNML